MFTINAADGNARAGTLQTKHGDIPTPFFMPVATKAAAKFITSQDLVALGSKAIISNAFIQSLRPGVHVIRQHVGIHGFMKYPNPIFTDCGGFQMIRKGFGTVTKDEGIVFVSPFDQQKVLLTPEAIMDIQLQLGSDVAMTLDDLSPYGASMLQFARSLKNTHSWAEQCVERAVELRAQDSKLENPKPNTPNSQPTAHSPLVFGICQGGTFENLRTESAEFINALPVDGVAIGGLCIGEPKEKMYAALDAALSQIDVRKPRYFMGLGTPQDILESIGKGVDCFDSIYPTQSARHGLLFTRKGSIQVEKAGFHSDMAAIDDWCDCYVCKTFTRSYLHHLTKNKEPVGNIYRSYHNLRFLLKMMEEARQAIMEQRFDEFKEEFWRGGK
ncbi:tRNA guanosine(34) transglycosylase Tgt [Candidatus Woesearchaeota archaeon]|nr:tRNA guanosine(34) transglycosylase Tgt [Candidatus Woesearchaeota archaeon]